jgi:hypothetical protein
MVRILADPLMYASPARLGHSGRRTDPHDDRSLYADVRGSCRRSHDTADEATDPEDRRRLVATVGLADSAWNFSRRSSLPPRRPRCRGDPAGGAPLG